MYPGARSWAAYVAGALVVLMHERGARFADGISCLVASAVPEGKGVSSSAALEVAVMGALAAAHGIELDGRELALLCQKAGLLLRAYFSLSTLQFLACRGTWMTRIPPAVCACAPLETVIRANSWIHATSILGHSCQCNNMTTCVCGLQKQRCTTTIAAV